MNYNELIAKALKGRSVNSMAKTWGLQQKTLDRYVKGESMPDLDTVLKIVKEAGVAADEALETLAAEHRAHKSRQFKLQRGFVQTDLLLIVGTGGLAALLIYIMSNCSWK